MDKCFNKVVCDILKNAEKEMLNLKHPYVGSEHLLLSLLKMEKTRTLCYRFNLTYQNFRENLIKVIGMASKKSDNILYTPLLKQIIDYAYNKAYQERNEMDELYLLSALLNNADGIALRIVDNMGIDIKELNKELNKPQLLSELGVNLNEKVTDSIYLREKEILSIMEILLRKNKNNPLLIGPAGVGKTAIIEELARRIKEGKVPTQLLNKEIILINTSTLIAGTKYRGEFEERVNNLVKEVINYKNIILFIDEIHNLVKTGTSDGSIDAGNILKPYLARGELSLIGATTTNEYNEYLKKDSALNRRFAPIVIKEPSIKDMEYILTKVKKVYENYYNLKINKNNILYIIEAANKYYPNLYNPDKSIELLDTVCAQKILSNYYKQTDEKFITNNEIQEVICKRININAISENNVDQIYDLFKDKYEEKFIKDITTFIKQRHKEKYFIINNDIKNKEIIIKTMAEKLNINYVIIDCKEYNDEYSINKLLNNNYLYNKILENPYGFLVFKNYDEVNRILHNIINTIISCGYITNSINEKLDLSNVAIFILSQSNVNSIGFHNVNNLLICD